MTDLAAALAAPDDQPATAFRALQALVQDQIGARLFTITERDPGRDVVWRSWSNMPDAYPVSGEKPIHDDRWSDMVIRRGQPFVANSVEEFADVFPDHERIRSLGCESCLNLPVIVAGEFLGSVNCLHEAGHYTPDRVAAADALRLPAAAALMLASRRKGGAA